MAKTKKEIAVKGYEGYTPSVAERTEGNIIKRLNRALEAASTAKKLMEKMEEDYQKSAKNAKPQGKTAAEIAAWVNNFHMRGGSLAAAAMVCYTAEGKINQAIESAKKELNEYVRHVCKIYVALREGDAAGKKGKDLLTEDTLKSLKFSDQKMVNSLFLIGFCETMSKNACGTASLFSVKNKEKLEELLRKHDAERQEDQMQNNLLGKTPAPIVIQ